MAEANDNLQIVTELPALPERPIDSHKGMFGRVLVVGGSRAMPGAVALAANAAYRAGAGLVRVFCPASAQPIVSGLAPCATSCPAEETRSGHFSLAAREQLFREAAQHDVLAVGPGMGVTAGCARLVEAAVSGIDKPVVLDASGLTNLASLGHVARVAGPLVITPHPGEMAHLLEAFGLSVRLSREEASRREAARAVAELLGCVVVLKGAGTVVTDGRRVYVNTTGNSGLATGGTGDILTGVLAGLIGQKMRLFEAAVLASYLQGLAGDIGARRFGEHGLMASDLLETLPAAFMEYASGR